MNADHRRFKHEDVTERIIGEFFDVYNELGFGFLESVYREAMVIALESSGLQVEKEFGLEARFRGQVVGSFKADLLVNGCVIVELKALKELGSTHKAQTLNYLRAGVLEVALLLNFGPEPQIRRLAFSNDRKGRSAREQLRFRTRGPNTQPSSICVYLRSSAATYRSLAQPD